MKQSATIGIIGDGQLALMLGEALEKRKIPFLVLGNGHESPMTTFFPERVLRDPVAFREKCSIFSLENEFHTIDELKDLLGNKSQCLFPDLSSYTHFADKLSQRRFYEQCGIPSPRWVAVTSEVDLPKLSEFDFPFVIKASKGGYDGKGVRIVRTNAEVKAALKDFGFYSGNHLLIEEKVVIQKEVAQGFLRHKDGTFSLLPLVETIQENGVCNLVTYPCNVDQSIQMKIEAILMKMMNMNLIGIFNFEFFVDENNNVLINEGAPRTHNSQHLTIDASTLSQFDLLAIYLSEPEKAPSAVETLPSAMVNILGKKKAPQGTLKLPEFTTLEIHPKLYGKKQSSPGRKLGHVNLVDPLGTNDLITAGRKILQEYDI